MKRSDSKDMDAAMDTTNLHVERRPLSPVHEEATKKCHDLYDYVPMVDKAVDAAWPTTTKGDKAFPFNDCLLKQDAGKANVGIKNNIMCGIMAVLMGFVTVVRLSRNMPRKLTEAALYGSQVYYNDTMVPGHATAPAVSGPDYISMMKRMAELEEKVIVLTMKPAAMPLEKEEMLNAALSRVENLEQQLSATQKALEDALVRQQELVAYIEKKKKKKKMFNPFCW